MAERRVILAGGAFTAALVFALAAWLVALSRAPTPSPPPITVAIPARAPVPPPAADERPVENPPQPGDVSAPAPPSPPAPSPVDARGGHLEVERDVPDGEPTAVERDAGAGADEPDDRLAFARDRSADDLATDEADPAAVATAPAVRPRRVVVIATGIAWSEDLARAAAARLPVEVAFALPADLPDAAARLADWRADGRDVVLRFAWAPVATEASGDAIPLDAGREVQAARIKAQWTPLAGDVQGAVIVEPEVTRAIGEVAQSVALDAGRPLVLGAPALDTAPRAWRLDPALLGEQGFHAALAGLAAAAQPDPSILLLEIYPGLLEEIARWLDGLDDEPGVALGRLDAVIEESR